MQDQDRFGLNESAKNGSKNHRQTSKVAAPERPLATTAQRGHAFRHIFWDPSALAGEHLGTEPDAPVARAV